MAEKSWRCFNVRWKELCRSVRSSVLSGTEWLTGSKVASNNTLFIILLWSWVSYFRIVLPYQFLIFGFHHTNFWTRVSRLQWNRFEDHAVGGHCRSLQATVPPKGPDRRIQTVCSDTSINSLTLYVDYSIPWWLPEMSSEGRNMAW